MNKHNQGVTRIIHWGMATLIIVLLVIGFSMKTFELYGYYPLHKSLGVVAIVAICIRLSWRMMHPWQSSMKGAKSEKVVTLAHLGLLVLLTLMPITGMFLSGFGGHGVAFFGIELIPHNYNEVGKAIPFNALLADFGYKAHEVIAYIFSALLILHIMVALKHHFINKNATLTRMLSGQ